MTDLTVGTKAQDLRHSVPTRNVDMLMIIIYIIITNDIVQL